MQKSESPYTTFKKWLLNNKNIELDEQVIKAINPMSVLSSIVFINKPYRNLTIYINDNFNKFSIFKYNKEFYKFLKEIVQKFDIEWNDFTFYNLKKSKKINNKLNELFPFLKSYEIEHLTNIVETNEDLNYILEEKLKIKKIGKTK